MKRKILEQVRCKVRDGNSWFWTTDSMFFYVNRFHRQCGLEINSFLDFQWAENSFLCHNLQNSIDSLNQTENSRDFFKWTFNRISSIWYFNQESWRRMEKISWWMWIAPEHILKVGEKLRMEKRSGNFLENHFSNNGTFKNPINSTQNVFVIVAKPFPEFPSKNSAVGAL